MSKVLDRAFKQFRDKIAGAEMLHIEVPQWPDEYGSPTIIYFMPLGALRTETYSKICELFKQVKVETTVDILILRALNSDKTPMFRSADRIEMLKKIDPEALLEIISKMGEVDNSYSEKLPNDVEFAEKN